jgi:hypothetical protein
MKHLNYVGDETVDRFKKRVKKLSMVPMAFVAPRIKVQGTETSAVPLDARLGLSSCHRKVATCVVDVPSGISRRSDRSSHVSYWDT